MDRTTEEAGPSVPAGDPEGDRMRLVIVGGVAAGMSAAARARRLDESAEIIVLERGDFVSYASCGLPYFVSGEISDPNALSVQTPESLRASLNLDIRPGHDVTAVNPQAKRLTVMVAGETSELAYDELLLAPGTVAARPPIPGLDSPRVRTLRSIPDALWLEEAARSNSSAVILGAGFIGLEVAEALRSRGLDLTVVEAAPHPLPAIEPELASLVTAELTRLGIACQTGTLAERITPGADADTVSLSNGESLKAQLIVLAAGVRPDTAIFEAAGVATDRGYIRIDDHGKTNLPHVWAAGDATVGLDAITGIPRPSALAGPAQRAGRLVADAICAGATGRESSSARRRPLPALLGTSIVRVGQQTVAMTGANRATLDRAGVKYDTIHVHPSDHAGYYPGAQTMHLIVHVGRGSGRLLGAQGVGKAGVDRRIDVLATAIRGRLTVEDLIDLDLAYSPVYGQAKDAVNLIGMVGENVASGQLTLWEAKDVRSVMADHLILDARSRGEFASGHLCGALNIPHTELRDRIDEVRLAAQGRPVAVMCAAGLRSYIAHRILLAAGFESSSLSGGTQTLKALLTSEDSDIWTTEEV